MDEGRPLDAQCAAEDVYMAWRVGFYANTDAVMMFFRLEVTRKILRKLSSSATLIYLTHCTCLLRLLRPVISLACVSI